MNTFSLFWVAIAPALGDHLWQSTLLALVAGLLTLLLQRNHARARYWLWLAASLKFLRSHFPGWLRLVDWHRKSAR